MSNVKKTGEILYMGNFLYKDLNQEVKQYRKIEKTGTQALLVLRAKCWSRQSCKMERIIQTEKPLESP